jgi:hypothetical protein
MGGEVIFIALLYISLVIFHTKQTRGHENARMANLAHPANLDSRTCTFSSVENDVAVHNRG